MFPRICIFLPSVYSSVCMSPPRASVPSVCMYLRMVVFTGIYLLLVYAPSVCISPLYIDTSVCMSLHVRVYVSSACVGFFVLVVPSRVYILHVYAPSYACPLRVCLLYVTLCLLSVYIFSFFHACVSTTYLTCS